MSENVNLNSFPSDETEALAYLYVQAQDLSGKTPTEIHTMYQEAYYEIRADRRSKRASGWFTEKKAASLQG